MYDYGRRYFSGEELLGGVLASAFQGTGGLPPFVTAQLVFPYQRGLEFVQRLVQAGGGRWTSVDAAHRSHPPVSTEQILHPDSYLRFEEPERVRLDPGDGARRRLAPCGGRRHGRVGDRPAAGRGRRRRGRRGRGLGRRSLRAVARAPAGRAAARRALRRDALVDAVALGHAERSARVRGRAAALGRGRPARAGGRSRTVWTSRGGARRGRALRRRGDAGDGAGRRPGGATGARGCRWDARRGAASGVVLRRCSRRRASRRSPRRRSPTRSSRRACAASTPTGSRGCRSTSSACAPACSTARRARAWTARDGAVAVVDADAGPGQIAGLFATDLSVELAREHGVGVVSVHSLQPLRRGRHLRRARRARGDDRGLDDERRSSRGPVRRREQGARHEPDRVRRPDRRRRLRPRHGDEPGRRQQGLQRPRRGPARSPRAGRSTSPATAITDPNEFYAVVPLGGYKGYGLALMVEVLSRRAGRRGRDARRRRASSATSSAPPGGSATSTSRWTRSARSAASASRPCCRGCSTSCARSRPRRASTRCWSPAIPRSARRRERRAEGIPLPDALAGKLVALSEELGVAVPAS